MSSIRIVLQSGRDIRVIDPAKDTDIFYPPHGAVAPVIVDADASAEDLNAAILALVTLLGTVPRRVHSYEGALNVVIPCLVGTDLLNRIRSLVRIANFESTQFFRTFKEYAEEVSFTWPESEEEQK